MGKHQKRGCLILLCYVQGGTKIADNIIHQSFSHITFSRYRNICHRYNMFTETDMFALVKFLPYEINQLCSLASSKENDLDMK